MRLNVYSIYDTAAGAYARPFFMQSDGQAMRAFVDIAGDKEHEIGRHPEDYSLFRLATFDDTKGVFHPEAPECLSTGLEAVAQGRKVMKPLGQVPEENGKNYGGTS